MQTLSLGPITIDAFFDGELRLNLPMMFGAGDFAAFRAHGGVDGDDNQVALLGTFVIRTAGRLILVDTGVGPDISDFADLDNGTPVGLLPGAMAAAGIDPADVTDVVLTHLHGDHTGWNTVERDGARVPLFGRARYLLSRAEWEHRFAAAGREGCARCIDPVEAAGQLAFVADGEAIAPGVEVWATPGHTPGHISLLVAGGGGAAVITGDAVFHPGGLEEPERRNVFDADAALAAETRAALAARAAAEGLTVLGGHFPHPTAGDLLVVEGKRRWRWRGA